MKSIDLLLYNGEILSMNSESSIENWIAIKDGLIFDIGKRNEYIPYIKNSKKLIDLKGKTILPGFYDSHVHLVQTGLNSLSIDASNISSIDELLELIKEKVLKTPENMIINVIGYDEYKVKEKRIPTRKELDKCSLKHCIWVNTVEYHTSVVNSYLLHKLNLPFNLEGIVRDKKGLPDGRLVDKASAYVRNNMLSEISEQSRAEGVYRVLNKAVANGITTINTMEGGYSFHDLDAEYIKANMDKYDIDLVLFYQTVNLSKARKLGVKRLGGCIFVDGSFMTRTAALSSPYEDDRETQGILYFTQEELDRFVVEAHKNNYQIALHAIGEEAIEQVLNSYEKAIDKYPNINHRHRIEHFELATSEQIKRAKELNIIVSMQPAYEYYWGDKGNLYETRLGDRSLKTNRFRKIIDEGIMIAGGSDSDVTPMDPLLGIHSAVNHPNQEWSVDVIEAIKMFTINGARAVFEEDIKGSLEKGKKADFVILEKNPLQVEKYKIKDIKVLSTFKNGVSIYESKGVLL